MRIMNIKYILLGFAVLLTACSSDNDEFNITNANRTQLAISTEIVTTRAYFNTGLKNDVEFREGNAISLWLFDKNGDDYSRYTNETTAWNRKAVFKNSTWNMDETITLTDVPAKVVAYYPYQETSSSNSRTRATPHGLYITKPIADIDIASFAHGDGQQDYLWGESIDSVDSHHPNARIQFKHILPRITFEVQKSSDNATDEIYLRSAILKNSADNDNTICTTGKLYENGSVYKSDATGQSITNGYTAPVLLNKSETRTFDFLVLPTEVEKGSVILRIEVLKGTAGNFQYYDIPIPATKWESGKQYTYPVTLNIKESQQETKETPGEKVYMGFNGDNGKPLYWSSWNLGATKIEDYGGLYGWGDPTGEHKEHYESTYRSDSYYMTDTLKCLSYYGGISPLSTIAGKNYDYAHVKWGDGWRIPSNNEFWILLDNCDEEFVKVNGVEGIRYTSKVNGKKLFFPMAPIRYGNAINKGQQSFYWLCNINGNDKSMAGTFYIDTYWKNAWPTAGKKRYTGLPIRPVTE